MRKNYAILLIMSIILIRFASADESYSCPVTDKMTGDEIINMYKNQKIDYDGIFNSDNSYQANIWFVDKKDPGNIIFYCEYTLLVGNTDPKKTSVCKDISIYTIKFILNQDRCIQDVALLNDGIEVQYIPKQVWSNAKKIEKFFRK